MGRLASHARAGAWPGRKKDLDSEGNRLYAQDMVLQREDPPFDLFAFQAKWREAREGTPVHPPVRPVFRALEPLRVLAALQAARGATVYAQMIQEEEAERKRRWEPPPLFAHDFSS
jgi:hypothetical protein